MFDVVAVLDTELKGDLMGRSVLIPFLVPLAHTQGGQGSGRGRSDLLCAWEAKAGAAWSHHVSGWLQGGELGRRNDVRTGQQKCRGPKGSMQVEDKGQVNEREN
jgi:hypothetical protein